MISKLLPDYSALHKKYFEIGKELSQGVDMVQQDKDGFFDTAAWASAAIAGLQGLLISAEYGGADFSVPQTCAAYEGFGKGSVNNGLNFAIGAHLLASVAPIFAHGSALQKSTYLPHLTSGKYIAANAITELDSGSDVFAMQGQATANGDTYILNASKKYITNASVADLFLTYVATDASKGFFGGISAFIVPANTPGISVSIAESKMGLRTCHMAHVTYTNVIINAAQRLGEEGAGALLFNQSMLLERTVLAAMHIGQLERVYEFAVAHCRSRKVNHKSIMGFTNVAHTLAEAKTILNAGRNLVYDAAFAIQENNKDSIVKASIAKLFVAEKGIEVIKKLQLLYGASGYLTQHEIEREYRDYYASLIYSGTVDIQKNIIAGYA